MLVCMLTRQNCGRYHTGLVFAVYLEGRSAVAKGGRYDNIGAVFGVTDRRPDSRLTSKHWSTMRRTVMQRTFR